MSLERRPTAPRRRTLLWLFAGYCFVMLYLLFFSRSVQFDLYGLTYRDYLKEHINLIPLQTVRLMLRGAISRLQRSGDPYLLHFAIKNLGGNILLFVPLGLFLPCIWKRLRRYLQFLLTVVCVIAAVETVQLLSTLGSMDVDDLLLNVLGASVGFGIWRLPPVQRALCRHRLIV